MQAHMSAADRVSFRASQRRLGRANTGKGMVLPFQPLNMAFHHVNYSVDLPPVRASYYLSDRLTFLSDARLHFAFLWAFDG